MIVYLDSNQIEGNWFRVPYIPPRDPYLCEVRLLWATFLDDLYATADRFQFRTDTVPMNGTRTLASTYCLTQDLDLNGNLMAITPSTRLVFHTPRELRICLWNTLTNEVADPFEVIGFGVELLFSSDLK